MVINLNVKFEVSTSNRSRDKEGSQNFKSRSRDPFLTPFDLLFSFLSLVHPVINLHDKFKVSSSNRSPDKEGSQNFKSRSRDPCPTPLEPDVRDDYDRVKRAVLKEYGLTAKVLS